MSITDELRGWARGLFNVNTRETLLAIADRIDAEHERAMADAELAAAPTEAQLEEWGYVELPKDVDGEYIHIGDVMEWCDSGETLTVEGIGRDVLFYIDGENAEWTAARNKRHHHEPTVEDVLREFAYGLGVPVADSYVAATAAKLRLAGDAE